MYAPCLGTATYDGKRSITVDMRTDCPDGESLVTGTYLYGGEYFSYIYFGGMNSLFPSYCPASTVYGTVTGAIQESYGGSPRVANRSVTGCLYDTRSVSIDAWPLTFLAPELFGYGCAGARDTPVFTWDAYLESVTHYNGRVCVKNPLPVWTVSW